MWVRSQDKNLLIICNEFRIVKGECLLKGKFIIKYETNFLGVYSSEQKALKVLNNISQCISNCIDEETLTFYNYGVFQMPQDDEVLYEKR